MFIRNIFVRTQRSFTRVSALTPVNGTYNFEGVGYRTTLETLHDGEEEMAKSSRADG